MRVYVPYVGEPQLATRIALRNVEPVYVNIARNELGAAPNDYAYYFAERWSDGAAFINVEHDVVPWPGALAELWDCDQPWCAFGYHTNDNFADHERTLFPYLGCVKFTGEFLAATGHMWNPLPAEESWLTLDRHVAAYARARRFDVHQHRPAVTNANPVLLRT